MVDALLYFRTDGTTHSSKGFSTDTRATVPAYTNPSNLPAGQKIVFTAPNNIWEGVDEDYENIVNKVPSINSSGTRRVFVKDSGMRARYFKIKGRLQQPSTDVTKLKTFRTLLQQDTYHIHGIIGLLYPNATFFSVDPTNLKGLMLEKTHVGHVGKILKRAMFTADLVFGGEHE